MQARRPCVYPIAADSLFIIVIPTCFLASFPRILAPISGNLILNGISLSRGAPAPFHYPPPHLKRPRLRSTKLRVKRKKGGRQEKKNLLIYTDYSEQEENDGLHHTSPTHNKKSTIQQAVRK
jgi:hypothetical protein